jgi:hypothetical protein
MMEQIVSSAICNSSDHDVETIELYLQKKAETDLAFLLTDGTQESWVPRSQVVDFVQDEHHDASGYYRLTEWIAKEKGFI